MSANVNVFGTLKNVTGDKIVATADTIKDTVLNKTQQQINAEINSKQDKLVSGTNLKTINNQPLLGSGNINIQGGGGSTGDAAVYLQQNKSLAEQIVTPNKIYVVQYDHKISNELTIPDGCVLDFRGGSIKGTTYINGVESDNDDAKTTYTEVALTSKTSAGYSTTVSVTQGDKFFITGEGVGSTPLYAFKNASGTVVESAAAGAKMYRQMVTAPATGTLEFSSTPYVGCVRKITQLVTHSGSIVFDDTEIRNSNFKNVTTNDDFKLDSVDTVHLDDIPYYNEWYNPKECTAMLRSAISWCKENAVGKLVFPHNKEYLICLHDYDGVSYLRGDTAHMNERKRAIEIDGLNVDFNFSTLNLEVNRVILYRILGVSGTCKVENGIIHGDKKFKDAVDPSASPVTNEFNYAGVCSGENSELCNMEFGFVHGDGLLMNGIETNSYQIARKTYISGHVDATTGEVVTDDTNETSSISGVTPISYTDHRNYKYIIPKLAYIIIDNRNIQVNSANMPINMNYYICCYQGSEFIKKEQYRIGGLVDIPEETDGIIIEVTTLDGKPYTEMCTWWMMRSNGAGFGNTVSNTLITDCGRNGLTISGQQQLKVINTEVTRYGGTNNQVGIDIENDEVFEFTNSYITFDGVRVHAPLEKEGSVSACVNFGCGVCITIKNSFLGKGIRAIYGQSKGHLIENCVGEGSVILYDVKDNYATAGIQSAETKVLNSSFSNISIQKGIVENCVITRELSAGYGDKSCIYRNCKIYLTESHTGVSNWASRTEDCYIHVSEKAMSTTKSSTFNASGLYRNCTISLPCLSGCSAADYENCNITVRGAYKYAASTELRINNTFVGNIISGLYASGANTDEASLCVAGSGTINISNNTFVKETYKKWYSPIRIIINSSANVDTINFANNTIDISKIETSIYLIVVGVTNDSSRACAVNMENTVVIFPSGGVYDKLVHEDDTKKNITLYIKDAAYADKVKTEKFKETFAWNGNIYMRKDSFATVQSNTASGVITPAVSEQYYDASAKKLYVYDGTAWVVLGTVTETVQSEESTEIAG